MKVCKEEDGVVLFSGWVSGRGQEWKGIEDDVGLLQLEIAPEVTRRVSRSTPRSVRPILPVLIRGVLCSRIGEIVHSSSVGWR